jgi:hypothetical protein
MADARRDGFLALGALAVVVAEDVVPFRSPGVAALGVGAGLLVARSVPWILGAAAWGLVTYLALLGCVLVGLGTPLTGWPGVED